MLKDKLNKLFKADGGDNKKKLENLIFLLIVLIITVVAINSIWNGKDKKEKIESTTNNKELASTKNKENANEEINLETRLEDILSKINGVGKVDVMLTYTESTEFVPVYNKTEKTSNTDETDSGGGKRKVEESDVSEEVVYEDENGKNVIATKKTVNPKIEGAIITAEGANNTNVKSSIIQAVEAATRSCDT